MRVEYGRLPGPWYTVADALESHGLVAGHVIVKEGGLCRLFGTLSGDLRVEAGGEAEVHGVVVGTVFADGAVTITGNVTGGIHCSATGTVVVSESAVVRRHRRKMNAAASCARAR
jgi:hypothetical protein